MYYIIYCVHTLTVFLCCGVFIHTAVIVGFQDVVYTFSESESPPAVVIVMRNIVSDTTLTLEVSAGTFILVLTLNM